MYCYFDVLLWSRVRYLWRHLLFVRAICVLLFFYLSHFAPNLWPCNTVIISHTRSVVVEPVDIARRSRSFEGEPWRPPDSSRSYGTGSGQSSQSKSGHMFVPSRRVVQQAFPLANPATAAFSLARLYHCFPTTCEAFETFFGTQTSIKCQKCYALF